MSVREFTRGLLLVAMLSLIFARTSAAEGEAQSISAQASSCSAGASGPMKIKVKVAGKELPATLVDNPTAREFAALLPTRVSMDDFIIARTGRRFRLRASSKSGTLTLELQPSTCRGQLKSRSSVFNSQVCEARTVWPMTWKGRFLLCL
ncbi:cyclophilin-like fold protein [Burkholderia sp. Ax-1724]|uniref:cyclophilin-like fold protein n=1 Tax=Burkholderia sp. Ax-1724 TaxID=2608336 RepID=UPI001F038EEF|nr:cyclophilin-like fold protein [Burkholderia sp. Ax-1724]